MNTENQNLLYQNTVPSPLLLPLIRQAILIRKIEETLLDLFSKGKLNGTVHTCVGQELAALAVINNLLEDDFISSNHRGHGHYIARTGDIKGLFAEILGKTTGSAGGIGGSQHLVNHKYLSNGIQGGMTPVVAGVALANKLKGNNNIAIAFIGDGTFGEGVLYETLNIASVWELPLMFVVENNGYAQSTSMKQTFAGSIKQRAEGFGVKYFFGSTNDPEALLDISEKAKLYTRGGSKPCILEIKTQRLNSHSKSDDNRNENEIRHNWENDYLNIFKQKNPDIFTAFEKEASESVAKALKEADADETLALYPNRTDVPARTISYSQIEHTDEKRINVLLGETFKKYFSDERFVMLGEDIQYRTPFTEKPYGGAFKVTGDLSEFFPLRVKNTPISEAAVLGIGTGLALEGFRPIVEIMFGDFLTLGFDHLLQHACKFRKMFNNKVSVPLIVRTPMGGKRGYGPTHSQSIEKFFLGIPDLNVIALNHRLYPQTVYKAIFENCADPTLVIENKILYTRKFNENNIDGFLIEQSDQLFPTIRISPEGIPAALTLVCYGGMLEDAEKAIQMAFDEEDILCEIICPAILHPFDISAVLQSVKKTGKLLIVEEGPSFAALGSEIVSKVVELSVPIKKLIRMGNDTIIPCSFAAEISLLPNPQSILQNIKAVFNG